LDVTVAVIGSGWPHVALAASVAVNGVVADAVACAAMFGYAFEPAPTVT
jgi:hypothetical protein